MHTLYRSSFRSITPPSPPIAYLPASLLPLLPVHCSLSESLAIDFHLLTPPPRISIPHFQPYHRYLPLFSSPHFPTAYSKIFAMNPDGQITSASLSTLPRELKRRICELAKLQDEAFLSIRNDGRINRDVRKKRMEHATSWHGFSLSALFLLNRDFNAIAAPFLFEVALLNCILRCLEIHHLKITKGAPTKRPAVFQDTLDTAKILESFSGTLQDFHEVVIGYPSTPFRKLERGIDTA